MVERVCPQCEAGNPLEADDCRSCGVALRRQLPAVRREHALARISRLPLRVPRAAQPIALGLAAVALEVGAALLQRRLSAAAGHSAPPASQAPRQSPPLRTTIGQRVWEEFAQDGSLRRRVVEQFIIRTEE